MPTLQFFFVTLTIMVLIDVVLGETAEFLNAWVILILLTKWIHGLDPPTERYFFLQDSLGNFSFLVGTLSLILVHAVLSFLIVTLIRALLTKKKNIVK